LSARREPAIAALHSIKATRTAFHDIRDRVIEHCKFGMVPATARRPFDNVNVALAKVANLLWSMRQTEKCGPLDAEGQQTMLRAWQFVVDELDELGTAPRFQMTFTAQEAPMLWPKVNSFNDRVANLRELAAREAATA